MVTKLEQLKEWAKQNVTLIDLLPNNNGLQVTTRLIDVLEDEVDEKYYLSEEKVKKLTLNTMQGGDRQPKIAVKGFKEIVKVRKYDVNKTELSELLRISKQDVGISNKEISNTLNVPITKVEHWFRSDKSFSIPDAKIWLELKTLLNITNTEHDEAVTTFVEKESEFETTNRIYDTEHLSPTLNTTSEPKIAIKQIGNIVDNKETFGGNPQRGRVYNPEGLSPALNCMRGGGLEPKIGEVNQGVVINSKICRRCNSKLNQSDLEDYEYVCFECDENFYEFETKDEVKAIIGSTQKNAYVGDGSTSPSLTSAMGQGGGHVPMPVYSNLRIRKLTPLECWRLQGFTDEQFYKAKNSGVSNSQLYKQSGNAITISVADAIIKKITEG